MIRALFSEINVPHGFFTRMGGVSTGAFASLNCGLAGQDDAAHVAENRARAARAIGAEPADLVGLKQVHGSGVITVAARFETGERPHADAMVTNRSGVALGIITADCAPVLFADTTGCIVGAAHSGWRGAVAGVLETTVAAMQSLGATTIAAVIGPCIQVESYEVGCDVYDAVTTRDAAHGRFLRRTGAKHWQFDLPGYAASRLATLDVPATILRRDTFTEEAEFFSHRRRTKRGETTGGHQISIIRVAT